MSTTAITPPVAKKVPHKHLYHNSIEIHDDYHWMKSFKPTEAPEIIEYLNAENDYAKKVHLEAHKDTIEKVYEEFVSRVAEDDVDVPVIRDGWAYYKKVLKGKQYPVYVRRKVADKASPKDVMEKQQEEEDKEQVLLDQNQLSFEYQSLGFYRVSPDHRKLAYSLDTKGDEIYDVYFVDLESGKLLDERIKSIAEEGEWSADGKGFYYTVYDDIHRPWKVMKRVFGKAGEDDCIYTDADQKFEVNIYKSNSGKFLFVESTSSLTKEIHYLNAEDITSDLKLFNKREYRHRYHVEHQGDRFLILTDGAGKFLNNKLCWCPLDKTDSSNWKDLLPYDPLINLADMQPFSGFIVLYERSTDANKRVKTLRDTPAGPKVEYLDFDEEIYSTHDTGTSSQDYHSDVFRFTYTSPLTPSQTLEHAPTTGKRTLLKQANVPNYTAGQYTMKRVYVPIPEESRVEAPFKTPLPDFIPVSMLYRTEKFEQNGKNPCMLYGYGSYGFSVGGNFDQKVFSYLDRGFVHAIAHIRGGGECGRAWYETGKFQHKKNTFSDFIAVAKYLHQEQYTKPEITAIEGRSAGGLLMGAVLNQAGADIASAAIAGVPFVDVINTMMDPTIPLTVMEYEEWGNPNELEFFDCMRKYSPYDNILEGKQYPDILVKAGINDPRVQYWEPAKWVAKLRDMNVDKGLEDRIIAFDCKMGSGHFGHSGRYAYLKEIAADYAFVIERLAKRRSE
ncbi:hypothetical protein HDU85_004302 [Gaertneriomyces sp. JEL0708]|nr:hypothetical protein HDU85_004302 [Gaertneriomyces sp. JEL0708]